MNRFIPQYEPIISKSSIDAVGSVMQSGWVGPGKITETFEQMLADVSGLKHAIVTTSGTVALMMAIESLNLKKGSTILFPSYTFLAGANAAKFLGHEVELVDIKEDTLCMDPDKIRIPEHVSCVMFVNHNAYVGVDVQRVKNICDQHGIPMIEDSSQALGVPNAGKTGDVAVFSFSVPKIITTGQGGVVVTSIDEIAEKCKQIRDNGDNWRKDKVHRFLGVNFKFNDILAAYGKSQLEDINKLLERRKEVFSDYRKHIDLIDFGYESTWMVLYRTKNAIKIIEELKKNNIQAVQYYRPLNHNPIYQDGNKYPVAEKIYNEVVYLPSSLNLTSEEITEICSIINKVDA